MNTQIYGRAHALSPPRPAMSRPRVFISHSSKEPLGTEFRKALEQRLQDAGYRVLVDKDIDLNQDWRSTLNTWIGGCDAAVVLLSDAALKSSYVAYEASLLAYRHRSPREKFLLIPVFLPPVTGKAVADSLLGPSGIGELQSIREDVPTEEALQRIVDFLEQHVSSPESLAERHAQRLCGLLNPVDKFDLEQAAKAVGVDLEPWTPGLVLPMKVALHLMAAGLKRAPDGIRYFRKRLSAPTDLDEMMTLIATSWVDCRSATEIPEIARRQGLLALNGEDPRTAWLYVVGACPIRPSDAWRVIQVDGVVGDKGIEELKSLIHNAIAQKFSVPRTPEAVHKVIRKITNREPLFVALPLRGMNAKMLEELRTEFQTVTFFFLTGRDPPSEEQLRKMGIELLQPMIEPGTEQPFWLLYDDALDYLNT